MSSTPRDTELHRRYAALTRVFCALIVLGCLAGIALPAGIRWDFANFYDTGRRALAGEFGNLFLPDTLIAGQPPLGGLQFYGAPLSAFLYVPMALLPPVWALMLFKVETALAYFIGLVLLYRELEPLAKDDVRFSALFAGCALIFQPFWTVFRVGGQTTGAVFLLFVLALRFHTRERFLLSAVCFSIAVMIKPAFAPALAFLAVISGWRFFFSVGGVLGAFGIVSLLILGWPVHANFLQEMIRGSTRANVAWPFSSSVYVVFSSLRSVVTPEAASLLARVSLGIKVALIGVSVFLVRRAKQQTLPRAGQLHFFFLTALAFSMLTAEVFWEHYLSMMFFLLAYVVAARRYFGRGALALVTAIFVLSVLQNLIIVRLIEAHFHFQTVPAVVFISLMKSSPLLLMLVLLLRDNRALLSSYQDGYWQAQGETPGQTRARHSAASADSWVIPSNAGA